MPSGRYTFINDYKLSPEESARIKCPCGESATTGQNNGGAPFWYHCDVCAEHCRKTGHFYRDDEVRERPDLPHDPDCAYRFHSSAECTCGKDDRPITVAGTIDMTPVGCQTPEGCKRVAEAQDEWDTATHMLANVLKEMLDTCIYGEGFSGDELHQLKALIGARDRKQEAFLRAVAGAPGKPK